MDRQKAIEQLKTFITDKLNTELPDNLYYHVTSHTLDVYHRVQYLGKQEGLSDSEIDLLRVAALFHDVGFIEQYNKNEPIGARIAGEMLPEYDFTPEEIEEIQKMIMATEMPHKPHTLVEKIIADADMDNLGRDDFYIQTEYLRLELKLNGIEFSPRQWYGENLPKLLEAFSYFTKTAQKDREPFKQKHLKDILELTGK